MPSPEISISIVSHQQAAMVLALLEDIEKSCKKYSFEVIITLNLPEPITWDSHEFSFPIIVLSNVFPKGFGANHNQAFNHARGVYFCVLNPDIRFAVDPFESLMSCLKAPAVGVVAPLVLGPDGRVEDSARYFPSPLIILCKLIGKCQGVDYQISADPIYPDWVGGMCMVFSRSVFKKIGGFDSRYFMYYEDVDLCGRLMLSGYRSVVCPQATVVHHAQRSSHRSFKYLRWHLASMMRFFLSSVYWRLQWHKLFGRT